MDRSDIEKTIRDLDGIIVNPDDRMSEVAIQLMTQLVSETIRSMDEAMAQALGEVGVAYTVVN